MWLSKHGFASKVIVTFIQIANHQVTSRKVMNLCPCCFDGIDVESIQLKFAVWVLGIRV
jgi:predicted GNAT family acetyltransferase